MQRFWDIMWNVVGILCIAEPTKLYMQNETTTNFIIWIICSAIGIVVIRVSEASKYRRF